MSDEDISDEENQQPMALQLRISEEAELASLTHEVTKQLRQAIAYVRTQSGLEPAEAEAKVRALLTLGPSEEGGAEGDTLLAVDRREISCRDHSLQRGKREL